MFNSLWLTRIFSALLLFTILLESCGNIKVNQEIPPKGVNTTITINADVVQNPIPDHGLGLSFENSQICDLMSLVRTNPHIEPLLKSLGPGVLRFGARGEEYSHWDPKGIPSCNTEDTVITEDLLDALFHFAQDIDWRIIWGMNFSVDDPTNIALEASYIHSIGGNTLLAFTFGSEPDLYVESGLKPKNWNYASYRRQWEEYYRAVEKVFPGAPIGGPDSCCSTDIWNRFLQDEAGKISFITRHHYITNKDSTGDSEPTIPYLLSEATENDTTTFIKQMVSLGDQKHLNILFTETNSVSSGGTLGVSNTFASSLWSLDYVLDGFSLGIKGMAFHNAEDASYEVIDPQGGITPMYYGLFTARQVTQNGVIIPLVLKKDKIDLTAYAVKVTNKLLRVVVIDKDLKKEAIGSITLPKGFKRAEIYSLRAPSVSSTDNITIGGSSIGLDGVWEAKDIQSVMISGQKAYFSVAPASASVITLTA